MIKFPIQINSFFRFYGQGPPSVKHIIQAIENDREDFLEEFRQNRGTLRIKVYFIFSFQKSGSVFFEILVN